MKTLVIIYEYEQVADVVAYVQQSQHEVVVVSCNYWAEEALRRLGVAVAPLTDYVPVWADFRTSVREVEELSRWYTLPSMSFFAYKHLRLGEMLEAAFCGYLLQVRGYIEIYEHIFAAHKQVERLVVPYSTQRVTATAGPFARFEVEAAVSTGAWYAQKMQLVFETLGVSRVEQKTLFPKQSFASAAFLRVYNMLIRLLPRKQLSIVVSDHWRNLSTMVAHLPQAEFVFVERKEITQIPWRKLLAHRVRFIHPLDMTTRRIRIQAKRTQQTFAAAWAEAKTVLPALPGFQTSQGSWFEIVEGAFAYMVTVYAERIVADIESMQRLLLKERAARVLIRASISGQHHFFILGEMSRQFGIPSIEVQHGIGVGILDPHSAFGHMHADYVAAYGPLIQRAFVRNGYAPERVIPTGSPRFDRYIPEREAYTEAMRRELLEQLKLSAQKPVVCVIMPTESTGSVLGSVDFSSYEFRDFVRALKDIQTQVPHVQYILKFRSPEQLARYRTYVEGVMGQDVALVSGDAFPFVLASDIVYTCFSTLAVECLIAKKPVILFPLKLGDIYFYNAHKDGALAMPLLGSGEAIPTTEIAAVTQRLLQDDTYYTEVVARGQRYIAENFTVTGDAAQQVAAFVERAASPVKK